MGDLAEIRDAHRAFIAERDWESFQDPKSLLLALVGEVGEVAELLPWLPADKARRQMREGRLHDRVADELADVLIYLVGLADQCDVDLRASALAKIRRSGEKYPPEDFRGHAPDRSDPGHGVPARRP
jgi:dCTP diphosphatase